MSTSVADPRRTNQPAHSDAWEGYHLLLADTIREIPAWGISLALHVLLSAVLGLLTFTQIHSKRESDLTTVFDRVAEPVEFRISPEIVERLGSDSDSNAISASLAAARRPGPDTHREIERRVESFLINPDIPIIEELPAPSEASLVKNFDAVGATEHTGGTDGAIDRLALEIAASLRERRTLVAWLFDESLSMQQRRNAIADRFENVYRQLGQTNLGLEQALKNETLQTAVVSFGRETHFLTEEPVADVTDIVKAIREVQLDESGDENVFSAVELVFRRWFNHDGPGRHNMLIVIVTDERGTDYYRVEDVIRPLSRRGVRVYCVGNAAVFGREKGYVRYSWNSEGEHFTEDLPVDQGPETVAPERLQLPFWTGRHQHLERMSSGYGPYALTRLCTETGGIYLIAEDSLGMHFDDGIMRNYRPDYRPIREYERQLNTNQAKAALVHAARLAPVERVPPPVLYFRADNDQILRQQITEAQKPLAHLDYHINTLQQVIESGEEHRDRLDSPRWKAGFDLAMGRVLAMRVRSLGYNAVLAEMKSNPKTFATAGSNQWRLVSSDEISGGSQVKRLHRKAQTYLNRVIDSHPGTPWAMLAGVELNTLMGWAWTEGRIQVAQSNTGNNTPSQMRLDDEEDRRRQERRRIQRELSRPRL